MTEYGVVSGISRATIWIGQLGVLGPWDGAELMLLLLLLPLRLLLLLLLL